MSNDRLTFPTYLLPSFAFPFRRRKHSPSTTTSSAAPSVNTNARTSTPGSSYSPMSSYSNTPAASPTSESFLERTISSSSAADERGNRNNESTYSPPQTFTSPSSPQPHLTRAHPSTIRCLTCSTHFSYASQIVSKGFTGRHGRAYLVAPPPSVPVPIIPPFPPTAHDRSKNLANIRVGRPVNRELLTGHHVVADVNCMVCNTLLGWKYVDAREPGQKYKIGKFILETKRCGIFNTYEDDDTVPHCLEYNCEDEDAKRSDTIGEMGNWNNGGKGGNGRIGKDGELAVIQVQTKDKEEAKGWVYFDSEDEDECEELFAGVWDAEIAQKRRIRRVDRRKREIERERAASKDSGVGGL